MIPSPSGTSAPLLSNPSLTDTLSNFPLLNQHTKDPNESTDSNQTTEPQGHNVGPDNQITSQNPPPTTTNRRTRPRGRPPGRRNQLPKSSSGTTTSSRRPTTRPKRGPKTRSSSRTAPRTLDRAMTLPQIPESSTSTQSNQLDDTSRQAPRYQLRANRPPKYRCGTCGSRNCSCIQLVTTEPPNQRLARGAAIPTCETISARTANHPQHAILNIRANIQKPKTRPTIQHIILTIEKTFTTTESESIPPLESTLKEMHKFSPSNCPTYRFKEWTTHEKGGLEFTLAATIPPLPPSFLFGELDDTCNNPQMIRCITANQLWKKYRITSPPGDVYQPSTGWWLLVTSLDDSSLVSPTTLLLCLEKLRTLVETSDTLCFHLADIYRGKFLSQHWLQLIAIVFCRQKKICIFDRLIYTPETPISPLKALSVMHSWSCVHMGNRPLHCTIWKDGKAVFGHLMWNPLENHAEETGKWLISQPKIRPSHVPWITYSDTDILQASGTLVLCCPADLQSQSATIRYIIREYGQEAIFRLKPSVGMAICLQYSHTAPWNNQIFLLCTRASNMHPLMHETLHTCLNHLRYQLIQHGTSEIHIPIYDPERSINLLPTWYATLRDNFSGSNLEIILHDRVYVSIASISSIDVTAG